MKLITRLHIILRKLLYPSSFVKNHLAKVDICTLICQLMMFCTQNPNLRSCTKVLVMHRLNNVLNFFKKRLNLTSQNRSKKNLKI